MNKNMASKCLGHLCHVYTIYMSYIWSQELDFSKQLARNGIKEIEL